MKVIMLSLALFVFALSSCNPIYYEPSSHNVPMMEEKGDFNLLGSADFFLNKGEVQASYAVTNNIGVMTNYMIKEYLFDSGEADTRNSQMFEAGIGYYNNFSDRMVVEAYGLMGKGSFDNRISRFGDAESLSGNMTKYALQLSLGLREKNLELAYSLKPTQLKFNDLEGNLTYGGRNQKTLLMANDSYTFIEHAITARFGYDYMKFQMQLGRGGRQFANNNHRLKSYLTLGLFVNINEFRKSNSAKNL